jgi:putative phosphonate metabolism protein
MTMRYAIYFTPRQDTPLWHFGSSAIGYDVVARKECPFPEHELWRESWFLRTLDSPTRYGFHATLKAPFELESGATEAMLLDRAAAFGAQHTPVLLPALEVALLEDFVALRPIAKIAELNNLAAACVQEFDDLRAPLTEADRARRQPQTLTPRQIMHLEKWGYPHVLEDFRFHMTLTGSIPASAQARVLDILKAIYRSVDDPITIDAISVLAQPTRTSRFIELQRFPLTTAGSADGLNR